MEDPLTRMAIAALESEAKLRDISLTISPDESLAPGSDKAALFITAEPRESTQDGKRFYADRPRVIRETGVILDAIAPRKAAVASPEALVAAAPVPAKDTRYLIGVTSCPTGIAHTFMAAVALL